jgi:hypothetical protein
MIAYIKFESDKFLLKVRYHEKIKELLDSIKCEQRVIETNVRSFPIEKLDDVSNGLLALNVSVEECIDFPVDPYDNKTIKYKMVDDVMDVYAHFSIKLIEMYKTIDGYKFNGETRRWNFPSNKLDEITVKAKELGYDCELEFFELPTPKEKALKAFMKKDNTKNLVYVECPYKAHLIEFFKTIKNKKFDVLTKLWSFPMNEMNFIQNKLIELDVSVEILKSNDSFKTKKTSFYNALKK